MSFQPRFFAKQSPRSERPYARSFRHTHTSQVVSSVRGRPRHEDHDPRPRAPNFLHEVGNISRFTAPFRHLHICAASRFSRCKAGALRRSAHPLLTRTTTPAYVLDRAPCSVDVTASKKVVNASHASAQKSGIESDGTGDGAVCPVEIAGDTSSHRIARPRARRIRRSRDRGAP